MSGDAVLTYGAVVNASPLLTLCKARLEDVLPDAVWKEDLVQRLLAHESS